jgi:protein TonB
MDKSYSIIISGIIAFSVYIIIILLFVLYLEKPLIKKYQSKVNSTIIELEIITDPIKAKKIIKHKIEKKIIKKDVKVLKSSSFSATKKTNLKSLFSKVSTKSKKVKVKKVLNIKNNTINSRFKSKLKEEKSRSELKIKNVSIIKKNKKISMVKNKDKFDEYYSKISSIILSRWYNYPLFTQNKYIVKVQININSKGRFSYNIILYSGDLNIDSAIKEFLKTQISEIYPQTKDKEDKNILINFINEKD